MQFGGRAPAWHVWGPASFLSSGKKETEKEVGEGEGEGGGKEGERANHWMQEIFVFLTSLEIDVKWN